MSFEQHYKLAKDIIRLMKAVDTGYISSMPGVTNSPNRMFYKGAVLSMCTHSSLGLPTTATTVKAVLEYYKQSGGIEIYYNGDFITIHKDDIILTPTEEQYFQNSMLDYSNQHLLSFLIYGLMLKETFSHSNIWLNYQHLDKMIAYLDGKVKE